MLRLLMPRLLFWESSWPLLQLVELSLCKEHWDQKENVIKEWVEILDPIIKLYWEINDKEVETKILQSRLRDASERDQRLGNHNSEFRAKLDEMGLPIFKSLDNVTDVRVLNSAAHSWIKQLQDDIARGRSERGELKKTLK